MQNKPARANDVFEDCCGGGQSLMGQSRAFTRIGCFQSLPWTDHVWQVYCRWYERRWRINVFRDIDSALLVNMSFNVALGR